MGHGILALDLGLNTGWCFGVGEKPPIASTIQFGHLRGGFRGLAFRRWLVDKIIGLDPAIVVRESPIAFHKGQNAAAIARGMAWEVDTTAAEYGVECLEQDPMTVKKHFTGSGNAKKTAPGGYKVELVCKARGWKVVDHNSADACALFSYTMAVRFPEDWRRQQAGFDLLAGLPRARRPIAGLR